MEVGGHSIWLLQQRTHHACQPPAHHPISSGPPTLQQQRAALLAASPRAKPFPRAQHTNPPSPPLSRRSPPISRPGSAPPPGLLCASLEQAAVQVELAGLGELAAGELGSRARLATGRALECSSTARAASYWQRWGLEAGPDFDGFLQRQKSLCR